MALIQLKDVKHSWGGPTLFSGVDFNVERNERIGLVGRNGAGKSTLMAMLMREVKPDSGTIEWIDGVRVARLQQDLPASREGVVFDIVAEAFGEDGKMAIAARNGEDVDDPALAWTIVPKAETIISRLGLDADAAFATLSGGMKRRVMLANALAQGPDVLMLDEPTNHLDIESVEWLEQFLLRENVTLLFVTHDRAFLQKLATRIVEVDRGKLRSWECDYRTFLERREQALSDEAAERQRFDKRLASEAVWANKNVSARRTKSVSRLNALEEMRKERAEWRQQQGKAKIAIEAAEKSGRLVVDAKNLTFGWPDRPIVNDLTTTIMRGDRLGLIGPNGVGKTTMIRVLTGEIKPTSGTVRQGTNLEVSYMDQTRGDLDPDRTVADTVADGNDRVTVAGSNRHVIGYLQDFLFEPERARQRVGLLSGGEKNRLLLAKLFLRPSNVLVLDEPTNDLDAETLELLEDQVANYEGTVIVVSHDRAFLDAVCTSVMVNEGPGNWREFVGGYSDWQRQKSDPVATESAGPAKPASGGTNMPTQPNAQPPKKKKLSWKEQKELDDLPALLEKLDADIANVTTQLSDPNLYSDGGKRAKELTNKLTDLEARQAKAFARWEELEEG
jgi:ATP-binding cassette subfamily F protein uup